MNEGVRHTKDGKPTVAVVADPNGIAVNLVEILLSEICRVNVVSEKVVSWNHFTKHLKENRSLVVSQETKENTYDYVIYFSSYFSKLDAVEIKSFKSIETNRLTKTLRFVDENTKKIIVILPYLQLEYFKVVHNMVIQNINNVFGHIVKTIFVGQAVGPRIVLSEKDVISGFQRGIVTGDTILVPKDKDSVYPVDVRELARGIIKETFSFAAENTKVALLGSRYQYGDFIKRYIKGTYEIKEIDWEQYSFEYDRRVIISTDIKNSLDQCILWFGKEIPSYLLDNTNYQHSKATLPRKTFAVATPVAKVIRDVKIEKKTTSPKAVYKKEKAKTKARKTNFYKYVKWPVLVLLCLLIIPYVFLFSGLSSFALGSRYLYLSNNESAKTALSISENLSGTAHNILITYSSIPVIGKFFEQHIISTGVVKNTSDLLLDVNDLVIDILTLTGNVFSDDPYDIEDVSKEIALKLDSVYKKSAFIENETVSYKGMGSNYVTNITDKVSSQKVRNEILAGKEIAIKLPILLGGKEDKTYLILFQNNMELRPTGGFIGSIALVTFSEGRLTEINVMDTYSADEQLKGHIDPPEPIKKYLNEANWYLRDSNWDPDFPTSAQSAQWFIDKEIEAEVDGVIAVDLELVRDILEIYGPLYLHDFDKEVKADDLYEVAKEESEKDFFPGSRKKAFFLTSVAQEIFNLLSSGKLSNFQLTQAIHSNLEERHIQVYLLDLESQNAVSKANWSGEVKVPGCDIENCYADIFGIAEANLGMNKANYFISRNIEERVFVDEDFVDREVVITLKNGANPALGDKARYRAYVRVIAQKDSFFEEVEIIGSEVEKLQPEIKYFSDRVEAGVLAVVVPKGETKLVFRWTGRSNLDFSKRGEYRMYIRKQAGTLEDTINMLYAFPDGVSIYAAPEFALTEGEYNGYNTTLVKDKYILIYW